MESQPLTRSRAMLRRRNAVCLLIALTLTAGCAVRRSATFLAADEVHRVKIQRQGRDVRTIENPQEIAQVASFLQETRKGWSPIWDTPWAGEYSIVLESGDSWQTVFVNGNTIQTNSDGAPVERKLSPDEQQRLLTLLGQSSDTVAEGSGQTSPVRQAGYSSTNLR